MKKIGFIFLYIISLLCITSCSNGNKAKEYVLTDTQIDAKEIVEGYKGTDDCTDIYLNDEGDVVVMLTDEQRETWLSPIGEREPEIGANLLPIFTYSKDYHILNIEDEKSDLIRGSLEGLVKLYAFDAEVQQVLNGEQDWYLQVRIIDSKTDTLLHTFSLPDEDLDWTVIQEK